MKVLITGGHATPALAVADELLKKGHKVFFVGRKFVNTHEKNLSFEYVEVTRRNIPFFHLKAGRFLRRFDLFFFIQVWYFVTSVCASFVYIRRIRPDRVISFGGYIALPVAMASWMLRIKIITHEQTLSPGAANKIIARLAEKACVAFPKVAHEFGKKVVITGNPIRKEFFMQGDGAVFPVDRPMLYFCGGSLGSHTINKSVEHILPRLLSEFTVIHQTGNIQQFADFKRLSKLKSKHYIVREHFTAIETSWLFRNAHVLITRSGANTVLEIIATRVPSVLVPLPWSANSEQQKQAEFLANAGVALIWSQEGETKELVEHITTIYHNRPRYVDQFHKLSSYIHPDAAEKIIEQALA